MIRRPLPREPSGSRRVLRRAVRRLPYSAMSAEEGFVTFHAFLVTSRTVSCAPVKR